MEECRVDALYKLVAAGVRAPKPYGYFNDTLIMERPLTRIGFGSKPAFS